MVPVIKEYRPPQVPREARTVEVVALVHGYILVAWRWSRVVLNGPMAMTRSFDQIPRH